MDLCTTRTALKSRVARVALVFVAVTAICPRESLSQSPSAASDDQNASLAADGSAAPEINAIIERQTLAATARTGLPVVAVTARVLDDDQAAPFAKDELIAGALVLIGLVISGIALTVAQLRANLRRRRHGYRPRGSGPDGSAPKTKDRREAGQR